MQNNIFKEDLQNPYILIKEQMKENNISKTELTLILNIEKKDINRFLRGELEITDGIAERLENCFGISYFDWIRLNKNYIEQQQKKYIKVDIVVLLFGIIFCLILLKFLPMLYKNIMLDIGISFFYIFMTLDIIDNYLKLKNV